MLIRIGTCLCLVKKDIYLLVFNMIGMLSKNCTKTHLEEILVISLRLFVVQE